MTHELDTVDLQLLALLQKDGRMSYVKLAKRVNLSAPAVGHRVERLEEEGIIQRYGARIDPRALGYNVDAFVFIRSSSEAPTRERIVDRIAAIKEITEFHVVTGEDLCMVRLVAKSMDHLAELVELLTRYGDTKTHVIFVSPIAYRGVPVPEAR